MADSRNIWPENVSGKFYVDQNCICTKFCVAVASGHFRMTDEGYAYVYRQPSSPDETARCLEALRGCAPGAIGDDGGPEAV